MTEPTQAAKQRACNQRNKFTSLMIWEHEIQWDAPASCPGLTALAEHIQAISDAVKGYREAEATDTQMLTRFELLRPFILPDEPDVLAEVLEAAGNMIGTGNHADAIRTALSQRGHEVAPIKELLEWPQFKPLNNEHI